MDFRARGINDRDFKIHADNINKETSLKLKWNDRFSELKEYAPSKTNWSGKVEEIKFREFCEKNKFREPVINFPVKKNKFDVEINEYLEKLGIKDKRSGQLNPVIMYQPENKERMRIYKGISHDHEGRFAYLKARKEYTPESRYPFPVINTNYIYYLLKIVVI